MKLFIGVIMLICIGCAMLETSVNEDILKANWYLNVAVLVALSELRWKNL